MPLNAKNFPNNSNLKNNPKTPLEYLLEKSKPFLNLKGTYHFRSWHWYDFNYNLLQNSFDLYQQYTSLENRELQNPKEEVQRVLRTIDAITIPEKDYSNDYELQRLQIKKFNKLMKNKLNI